MTQDDLVIPPPRADRPPLRVNVFETMQHSNTQLVPLFPYLHPGAMVPAGAMIIGGPDAGYGHFFHHNTQDEVVLALAANGAVLATGQVFVGARIHGVNSFLKNEKDPKSFAIMVITQRQVESGPQTEACSLRCEKCHEEIYLKEFDATPPVDALEGDHPFVSIAAMPALFAEFNNDAARRVCPKCGHANKPFPVAAWGWDKYAAQSEIAIAGRQTLMEMTRPTTT
ncbi:MAG: hypothetical protein ACREFD_02085 [Stellaceae bacterium]